MREHTVQTLDAESRSGDFIAAETAELKILRDELAALGYNANEHQRFRARLKELSTAERELADIENAAQSVAKLDAEIETITQTQSAHREKLTRLEKIIADLKKFLTEIAATETKRVRTKSELETLERVLRQESGKLKSLQARVDELKKKRSETAALKERTKADRDDEEVYQKLGEAFGINGIQSMLIENAVPELEQAANEILSKLTGNAAALTVVALIVVTGLVRVLHTGRDRAV